MSKFVKGICSFAGSLLVLGIVMLLVGFFMGGRPQGLSLGWDNGPVMRRTDIGTGTGRADSTVTVPLVGADTIRSLEIDIGAAEVELRTSSEFSLDVTGNVKYTSTVENGVWELSNEGPAWMQFSGKAPRYVITVPAGFAFEDVTLKIAAGTLKATGLQADNAYVSVGAGTMTLSDFIANKSSFINVGLGTLTLNGALNGQNTIECGMGTAKFLVERPADYGYTANSGIGSVKIDGKNASGIGATMEGNAGAATLYDINCGVGTVTVEFTAR